jgi:acetyltransferase-like isoleucine patch superfamily enzyme
MKKIFKYAISMFLPKIFKNFFLMAKYHCIIHPSANIVFPRNLKIGKGTIIGKCDIRAQGPISIGEKSFINDYVILNSKTGYITIGDRTSINHYSVFFGNGGVEIGSDCAIGLNVQIVKNHIISPECEPGYPVVTESKTIIGDSVWICSNVVVVDGVKIGNFSVVGSNSLVVENIPERMIAGGTPAKTLRKRVK